MANRDWNNMGDEIKDIVQRAVDSQNFNKLNQTINDTIRNVTDNIKSTTWTPKSGFDPTEFPFGDRSEDSSDTAKQTSRNKSGSAGQYRYNYHTGEKKAQKKTAPTGYTPTDSRSLTVRTGSTRGIGLAFSIIGFFLAGCFGLALLILVLLMTLGGDFKIPILLTGPLLLLFFGGSLTLGLIGQSMSGRVKRFQNYIRCLGSKTYCNIQTLAQQTGKKPGYILKDLQNMIHRGWFLEGHIDAQKTCLITSNETFRQYEELQAHLREQQSLQNQTAKASAASAQAKSSLSPDAQSALEEGNEFLTQIRLSNDAIPGAEISEKISRMELIVKKIFERVEQEPEVVTDLRRMMDYYLPTTIKLLKAYEELDKQSILGENIISSKKEIEGTIDTLNVAFEKLLDNLFKDTAWDVSSDISVLQTMLAQEGLTKDDFK